MIWIHRGLYALAAWAHTLIRYHASLERSATTRGTTTFTLPSRRALPLQSHPCKNLMEKVKLTKSMGSERENDGAAHLYCGPPVIS